MDGIEPMRLSFEAGCELALAARVRLMGGKGAALAHMQSLGLPVPPGFTLTTAACHNYLRSGWTDGHATALADGLRDLQITTGKRLGDPLNPLLVSVRSGAPLSMPGMMDTVLNAGMSVDVATSLGTSTGDARFGWDTYRRFVQSYVSVVLSAPAELVREVSVEHLGDDDGLALESDALGRASVLLRNELADRGYCVPEDPDEQVRNAVQAVFRSWKGDRAVLYRQVEGIDDGLGTAATVQMMTFGNLGERSGTGVAFSRNPSTGAPGIMGDFLQCAQGEDVVAGTHHTLPVSALGSLWPDVLAELERTTALLERDLAEIVDIEFTIEDGTFWLLQVRRGKHSPRAALRMAIDMAEDPDFPLTRSQALSRVADILADPPTLAVKSSGTAHGEVLASGRAASPGRAIGGLSVDVDAAIAASAAGEAVILVRRETSPADVAGMAASVGIITSLGGLFSHAAVVARGWGIPAVVGVDEIALVPGGIRVGDRFVAVGTEITVDGTTGEVFLGAYHGDEVEAPEVAVLRGWQHLDALPGAPSKVAAYGEDVSVESVERALAIKGMGDAAAIAAVLGADAAEVQTILALLVEGGEVKEMPNGRVRPSPSLMGRVDRCYADAAARIGTVVESQMVPFHAVNIEFKTIVTNWQLRYVDGEQVPNDHSDADYDAGIIALLRADVHTAIEPIVRYIAESEPRLERYLDRLEAALHAIEDGSPDMVAHPMKDSYHTVWFELHEELIRLSGRNRGDEAEAGRG